MTDGSRASTADLTQHEAAAVLGVDVGRVGWLVACQHLDRGVERYTVTSESVQAEAEWRRGASQFRRVVRLVRDTARWF